jgi:hypothetical protein
VINSVPIPLHSKKHSDRHAFWAATALLGLANLILFWRFLSPSTHWVMSCDNEDLAGQFLWWRQFGFEELKKGHLALWNPYLYCGEPFFGGFQSALLYPPNWLFMVLPLLFAVNLSIVLHVFLAGWFTFLWARNRGARWESALLASFSFMWGGAYILHIVPGHLSNLCAMAWIPLVFFAVERFKEKRDLFSLGLGMAALALQIFSGHIQYVYYTLLVLAFFVLLDLRRITGKASFLGGVGLMLGGAALLSAVQLMAGWNAAFESARSGTMTMYFVDSADLTLERLWCLFMPNLFGDWNHFWGGGLFWEGVVIPGLTAFSLALFALVYSRHSQKWTFGLLGFIFILVALGQRAPLFGLFYRFVPLFSHFRGIGKFNILISLCLAALAVMGLEDVLNQPSLMKKFRNELWGFCGLFGGLGFVLWLTPSDAAIFRHIGDHTVGLFKPFLVAGLTLGVLGWIAWAAEKNPLFRHGFLFMAVCELFFFAQGNLPSFDYQIQANKVQTLRQSYDKEPGDYRIFVTKKDYSLGAGAWDVMGDDPAEPLRYDSFVQAKKEKGPQFLVRGLLRLRYVFWDKGDHYRKEAVTDREVPRAFLVGRYEVASPDSVLSCVTSKKFDPRKLVYLESEPGLSQGKESAGGSVAVKDLSTDDMEITAHCPSNALLVITDNYSKGWKAKALPDSDQKSFQVLPANGFQRGIPLQAGSHHFLLQYRPAGFEIGKWISIGALALYLILGGLLLPGILRRRT